MSVKMKIVLIDANAVMHRAYHAMPPLTTGRGELVNMVYGFTTALFKVIKDLEPTHLVAAFDVAGGTFRNEKFADYKAKRKKPEQAFYDQIPRVKEVLAALGVMICEAPGFEADDVIGTLAERMARENPAAEIYIATGDMDALQLVGGATRAYVFRRGLGDTVIYDDAKVKERYGITPAQVVDFKGLRGDTSDNIPGVKGIGDKGATKLLQAFGTMQNIYEILAKQNVLPDVSPRVVELLKNQKREALLSFDLATIRCDVPVDCRIDACEWTGELRNEARELFAQLEFFSLLNRFPGVSSQKQKSSAPLLARSKSIQTEEAMDFVIVKDTKTLALLRQAIARRKQCILKTFNAADEGDLTGLLLVFPGNLFFLPMEETTAAGTLALFPSSDPTKYWFTHLQDVLENEKFLKIGWEQKKDIQFLAARGIKLRGLKFDVHLATYLLNPGKREYALKPTLAEKQEVFSKVFLWRNESEVSEEMKELLAWAYLEELAENLQSELKKAQMDWLFAQVEMPLITMLAEMEALGVKVDTARLSEAAQELDQEISRLTEIIRALSDNQTFNLNSPQQLSVVLFEEMKLPTVGIKKNQKGYSVAAGELEKLREANSIIDHLIAYKELFKLKSTYVDALPKLLDPHTCRVHTTFHQTVTATGRLSSSNPNLQNIPARTAAGRSIRRAFVAEPNRMLLSGDYSQIELRLVASLANDPKMQAIFAAGADIHTATGAKISGVSLAEVTPQMRRAAKAINFGIIYGVSSFGLSNSAGISRAEAKEFIAKYLQEFSAVDAYLKTSKIEAVRRGYAQTLWGRRRYLPELKTRNAVLRQAAERMAINMPVQGTAADLMKICMLVVRDKVAEINAREEDVVRILLQVHDELVFSVRADWCEQVARELKPIMETAHENFAGRSVQFAVPIQVDFKCGKNWEEMKKINL